MSKSLSATVSIIIPVFNGGNNFKSCIKSIQQLRPSPYETIIIDDGSTDDSPKTALLPDALVVCLQKNSGPAIARNIGAARAKGDILFFIDADVLVPSNAIEQITKAFTAHPEMSAVIGSYDDSPGKNNFLSQYKNLFHHFIHQNSEEVASTFWGACGAIKRDVFTASNGFNENYTKASIEDIELGSRLVLAGEKIKLLKSFQVKHLKHWTFLSLLISDVMHRAIPWAVLIARRRIPAKDLNLGLSSKISVWLVWSMILLSVSTTERLNFLPFLIVCSLVLILINLPVYIFFLDKRGLFFALRSLCWHWFYYFYCGLGFILGLILTANTLLFDKNKGKDCEYL